MTNAISYPYGAPSLKTIVVMHTQRLSPWSCQRRLPCSPSTKSHGPDALLSLAEIIVRSATAAILATTHRCREGVAVYIPGLFCCSVANNRLHAHWMTIRTVHALRLANHDLVSFGRLLFMTPPLLSTRDRANGSAYNPANDCTHFTASRRVTVTIHEC